MRRLSERQQQLLQLLADGDFHSGEQIGQQLAISRAAISLQVKGLSRRWGWIFLALPVKGIVLPDHCSSSMPLICSSYRVPPFIALPSSIRPTST